jgi:hypothetical protein
VGVLPAKDSGVYDFSVTARGDLDIFTLSTCAREQVKESAWNVKEAIPVFLGWTRKITDRKKIKFTYQQTDLERKKIYCPIILEGLEKVKGRHSWAFLDIQDRQTTLPAYVSCNGKVDLYNGVSICQTRKELFIQVTFTESVIINSKCTLPEQKESAQFTWPIDEGECVYIFKNRSGMAHRLTILGYTDLKFRD